MANSNEKLFSDFPHVTTEEWMAKITADLKGADFDKKLGLQFDQPPPQKKRRDSCHER